MITEDQLETRLRHYGSVLRNEVRVSPSLHGQIIKQVDRRAPVRSQRFVMQLAAAAAIIVVVAGAVGLVLKYRADQLAKAAPQVTLVFPADGATSVPLKGEFRVTFAIRPDGSPTLRADPADPTLQPLQWDGTTMIVKYSGLHPSVHYEMILSAGYRSHLGDRGQFEKRWGFTAEGPAQIAATTPAAGENGAARNGQLSIRFVRRPLVDPAIRFDPPDGSMQSGQWTDTTWAVNYSGLQPLRSYRVLLDLDLGDVAANFHHEWSFTTEPGTPPNNVALVWYATSSPYSGRPQDPNRLYRMLALDWNGTLVGSLYATSPASQAADGTRIVLGSGYADQAGTVLAPSLGLKGGPGFADDSRHVCTMRDANGAEFGAGGGVEPYPSWLFAGPIGGPLYRIGQAGQVGGQSGPEIAACSYEADRAVVVEYVVMWTAEVRVLRLSTGALLYQHQYKTGEVASSVVASRDGRYLAEQMVSADAQGLHQIYTDTLIRRTSDGTVVGRLAGQSVRAFSWDGSSVITMPALGSADSHEVRLVDWQHGKVLWRLGPTEPAGSNAGDYYVFALPRPGGSDFMVGAAVRPGSGYPAVDTLWLVHASGTATAVARGPIFPGF